VNKINIIRIVAAHFETFRDAAGNREVGDFALFLGLPLVMSIAAYYFGWFLYLDALNAMLAAFSIFAGLLLNLLLLVYTFSNNGSPSALANIRKRFVRELHDNLAFAVVVSVVIVCIALVSISQIRTQDRTQNAHAGQIMSSILIFFTTNFVLTLLMVLKRIHVILGIEIDKPPAAVRRIS
jgi:hypothetical protein